MRLHSWKQQLPFPAAITACYSQLEWDLVSSLAVHARSWLSWSCTDLDGAATVAVSPWVQWPCHVQKTVLHNIACFQSSPLVCRLSVHYILLPYFSWRTFELVLSFDFMNDSAYAFVWICFNFSWIMYLWGIIGIPVSCSYFGELTVCFPKCVLHSKSH